MHHVGFSSTTRDDGAWAPCIQTWSLGLDFIRKSYVLLFPSFKCYGSFENLFLLGFKCHSSFRSKDILYDLKNSTLFLWPRIQFIFVNVRLRLRTVWRMLLLLGGVLYKYPIPVQDFCYDELMIPYC